MELRELKTFSLIAKLGSFNQAAEQMGYAPSTVTNHIRLLEEELGVKLFERLGHHVSLSMAGKAMLPYIDKMLALMSEAKVVAVDAGRPKGVLTIGTGESISTYRLPLLLREYRRRFPEVEVVVRFSNCSVMRGAIRENQVDLGLFIDVTINEPDLVVHKLSPEPLELFAVPGHPLAKAKKVNPDDLTDQCVIITEPGCSFRRRIEAMLATHKIVPLSYLEVSSVESIKQFVQLGMGVAFLPKFVAERELLAGELIVLKWAGPPMDYFVQLAYHKDKWLSATMSSFLGLAEEMLKDRMS